MRDIETIDSELRLVAVLRRAARERGRPLPTTAPMDKLLDEPLAHRGRAERARDGSDRLPWDDRETMARALTVAATVLGM